MIPQKSRHDMSTNVSDDEEASDLAWSEIHDGDEEAVCEGPLDRLQASLRKQSGSVAFPHEGPLDRHQTADEHPRHSELPAGGRSWLAVARSTQSCQDRSQPWPSSYHSSRSISLREEMQSLAASINSSRALARPQHRRA